MSPLDSLHSQSSVYEATAAVSAFIQEGSKKRAASGKPEVDGYEFQSNGIIKMLSELQDKFHHEKVDLEKAETDKRMSYEVTKAGLEDEVESETKDRNKKDVFKQKKLATKAKTEDRLSTTRETKKSDEEYLAEITTTCDQKASDFKARQKLRVEELEAVNKAIGIVSNPDVMANEAKHLWKSSFVQMGSRSKSTSLVVRMRQVRSDTKDRLTFFLQREAERLHSADLSKAALVLSSQADDTSTMKMIQDMLIRLLDDLQKKALADQTHKVNCDKKLATNKQVRAEKTASTEELNADLETLQAQVTELLEQINELNEQVSDLDESVANATAIRKKESEKNNETITDAVAAQDAVAKATAVLEQFYGGAAQATALVQNQAGSQQLEDPSRSEAERKREREQPEIFDSPYNGQGESGGVLDMLNVIASDFAKLEAETKEEEESSAAEFEKFRKESKLNKKMMTMEIKNKKDSVTESKARISEKSTEFDQEDQALNASNTEYEALKEECLKTGFMNDYEEKTKRREETIESLQKALTMLNNLETDVTSAR